MSCLSLQKCDEIIVLHLGYLNYTQYQVMVSFNGLENITYEIKVKFVVCDCTLLHFFGEEYLLLSLHNESSSKLANAAAAPSS